MARKEKTDEPEYEQEVLDPDFKPVKNARVHKAAQYYYDAICERLPYTKEEKEAHDSLLNVMMEEGIDHYAYKGVEAHCNTTRHVKVKVNVEGKGASKPETDNDDDGED